MQEEQSVRGHITPSRYVIYLARRSDSNADITAPIIPMTPKPLHLIRLAYQNKMIHKL
jgi:hypothetical protein